MICKKAPFKLLQCRVQYPLEKIQVLNLWSSYYSSRASYAIFVEVEFTLFIFVEVTGYYFENLNGGRRTSIKEYNKVIEDFVMSNWNFTLPNLGEMAIQSLINGYLFSRFWLDMLRESSSWESFLTREPYVRSFTLVLKIYDLIRKF